MFSLVIPCFNEIENLKFYKKTFISYLNQNINNEVVFVDNGSSDNSFEYLNSNFSKFSNVKIIKIVNNLGYGNGFYQGILKSKFDYVSWIHADLQVNLNDILTGYRIFNDYIKKNELIYVKGLRKKRNLIDSTFTFFMSILVSLIFFKKINDINSTPNILNKKIFHNIKNIPKDFNFELFCYLLSIKLNYKIIRFDVLYKNREKGFSKWNINFFSKFILSYKIIKFTLYLRFKGFQKLT